MNAAFEPSMGVASLTPAFAAEPSANERRRTDRRSQPTTVFSRYTWFGGRRASDRRLGHLANTYVDRYEPHVGGALIAIAVLCALDAIFTLLYVQKGGGEANPLMDALIGHGPQTFIVVKCGITNLGLLVLCLHKNFKYVKPVIATLLVTYGLLFLYHLYLAAVVT